MGEERRSKWEPGYLRGSYGTVHKGTVFSFSEKSYLYREVEQKGESCAVIRIDCTAKNQWFSIHVDI